MFIRHLATLVFVTIGGASIGYAASDLFGQWALLVSVPIIVIGGIATGLSMADATMRRRDMEGRF